MKRYSPSELRQRLPQALDAAERGEHVVVERQGRRFRIVAEPVVKRPVTTPPPFFLLDDELTEYGWTWEWEPGDLRLVVRKPPANG